MDKKSVSVTIIENNRVLLLKRKKEPYKGCWGLPGGKIEENETPQEAAIREVFEETNLLCSHLTLLKDLLNPEKHEFVQWFLINEVPEQRGWSLKKCLELRKEQPF